MKKILILNGPNLNLLGLREPEQYGSRTLADVEALCHSTAARLGYEAVCFQSNVEGLLIDKLQREPALCTSGMEMFLNLMEAIIDRSSDILSKNGVRVEGIAGHVFSGGRTVGFAKLITKLGEAQLASARIEPSLAGLLRIGCQTSASGVFSDCQPSQASRGRVQPWSDAANTPAATTAELPWPACTSTALPLRASSSSSPLA